MQVNMMPQILRNLRSFVPDLPNLEICILGGTGFVGKWLVNSLLHMSEEEDFRLTLHIVTRNVKQSKGIFPVRFQEQINWIEHDLNVRTLKKLPNVDFFVNGPTPSVVDNSFESQESLFRVTLNGVLSIKESIQKSKVAPRVVNLSSGAVYEKAKSIDSPRYEHDHIVKNTSDFYIRAKIESENILQSMSQKREISVLNLRLFALYGPYLPVDKHFAIGNFIRDALTGKKLSIKGNPKTKRSYLHGADLATAIIKGLFSDFQGALNIGSKSPISMEELATTINLSCGGGGVECLGMNLEPNYYYPSVSLSEEILGPYELTPFEEGLREWKIWLIKSGRGIYKGN